MTFVYIIIKILLDFVSVSWDYRFDVQWQILSREEKKKLENDN